MAKDKAVSSGFREIGLDAAIEALYEQVQELYLSDNIPWVVGYSGGKDSTATLQLVWKAISRLDPAKRTKPIHVISTDTLVENPAVAAWVEKSLAAMRDAVEVQGLPISVNRLTPSVPDRFWVNLIGKGYPAPRHKFRWCTSRLKINPSNRFITDVVRNNGEAILVLGTRLAESAKRQAVMKRYEGKSTRELLSANRDLDRVWVYTPIRDWTNDDVWEFLTTDDNPWRFPNSQLLSMYRGATKDNECPLVVDSQTPSCGDSRFGCYVCTMVDQDKSMEAMVQNDDEKRWMKPLLDFRNSRLNTDDRSVRDFRRMNGSLMVFSGRLVHGPYKQEYRESMLLDLLRTQETVRKAAGTSAPQEVKSVSLISLEELEEIRRIWVMEKHEFEDSLPRIYERATGREYPGAPLNEGFGLNADDLAVLEQVCSEDGDPEGLHYQLTRELLHVEQQYRTMARRAGLFERIDRALEKGAFDSASEAEEFALERAEARTSGLGRVEEQ